MNILAIRKLLELIHKKFGPDMKIEIYSDGSGLIFHNTATHIYDYIFEFDGLGELAQELDKQE